MNLIFKTTRSSSEFKDLVSANADSMVIIQQSGGARVQQTYHKTKPVGNSESTDNAI